jgi:hypothetical protein
MQRSHSRWSYPFDKRVPKMIGYNSLQRQLEKKMHKKKQRQHDRKLCSCL